MAMTPLEAKQHMIQVRKLAGHSAELLLQAIINGDFSGIDQGSATCRFATLAHSFEAYGQQFTASGTGFNWTHSPGGSHFWLQGMMGPRFFAPPMQTGRHAGLTTSSMLAGMPVFVAECIAQKVNTVFLVGLCNDTFQDAAATDAVLRRVTDIVMGIVNAGIRCLISNDFPRGSTFAMSAASLKCLGRAQEYIMRDLPKRSKLIVPINVWDRFVAVSTTDGTPVTTYFQSDQLHPNYQGHYRYAYEIFRVLDKLFPGAGSNEIGDNSFPYDATLNKRGNLLANGILDGNVANVATSWTSSSAPSGITVTPAKGTFADGTPYQEFAYTGTAGSAGLTHQLRQDPSTSKILDGDVLQPSAYCLIKAAAAATGYTNLRGCECQGSASTSSPAAGFSSQSGLSIGVTAGSDSIWPDIDWSQFNGGKGLFMRGPDTPIGLWTGKTPFGRLALNTTFDGAAATDIVVRWSKVQWKKILDEAAV